MRKETERRGVNRKGKGCVGKLGSELGSVSDPEPPDSQRSAHQRQGRLHAGDVELSSITAPVQHWEAAP